MKQEGLIMSGTDSRQKSSSPLVSIGMPIYNEEHFLEESLKSLLDQDYENIQIIISNNASTDGSEEICKEFKLQNHNISYYTFRTNQGVTKNFVRVLQLAKGKYFMWASGHDLWSENLVSDCVSLLENNESAVLAFGCCNWIDRQGNPINRFSGWTDTRGMDPIARYFSIFWGNVHPILGVIRTADIRKTRLLAIPGSDLIQLTELVLLGNFLHAPAASWSRREVRGLETYKQRMERYKSHDSRLVASSAEKIFPLMKLPVELLKSIMRSEIVWQDKIGLMCALLPALAVKYFSNRIRQS
jgi:glycosyltransferase involved in cell wall biosynthesis